MPAASSRRRRTRRCARWPRRRSLRIEGEMEELYGQMRAMLLPKDPRDEKNVIMEVRAGTGGDEAGLFAADLYRMYIRYAELHRWKTEILSFHDTGVGGYKEVVFQVRGKGAYSRLKYESGVHRVQRVPLTEAQGRIHTSTATVAVLPEVEEVEIADRSGRPPDRRLWLVRAGRSAHAKERHGGAPHPQADGHWWCRAKTSAARPRTRSGPWPCSAPGCTK